MRKYFVEAKNIVSQNIFRLIMIAVLIALIVGFRDIHNYMSQVRGSRRQQSDNRPTKNMTKRINNIDFDIIWQSRHGYWDRVISAIQNGANVNARDWDFGNTRGNFRGRTPLMFVVSVNVLGDLNRYTEYSRMETIAALVYAGADVNAQDNSGMTPLMITAENIASPEIVSYLVNAGADVNAQDDSGMTPLMFAARAARHNINPIAGREMSIWTDQNTVDNNFRKDFEEERRGFLDFEVVTTLLDFWADPNIIDNNGRKAIDYAKENRKLENTEVLRRLEEVSY